MKPVKASATILKPYDFLGGAWGGVVCEEDDESAGLETIGVCETCLNKVQLFF